MEHGSSSLWAGGHVGVGEDVLATGARACLCVRVCLWVCACVRACLPASGCGCVSSGAYGPAVLRQVIANTAPKQFWCVWAGVFLCVGTCVCGQVCVSLGKCVGVPRQCGDEGRPWVPPGGGGLIPGCQGKGPLGALRKPQPLLTSG